MAGQGKDLAAHTSPAPLTLVSDSLISRDEEPRSPSPSLRFSSEQPAVSHTDLQALLQTLATKSNVEQLALRVKGALHRDLAGRVKVTEERLSAVEAAGSALESRVTAVEVLAAERERVMAQLQLKVEE